VKTWMKVALVTAICALPAMLLGRVIWPAAMDFPTPSSSQMPFFMILAACEALAFGLGVSFLIFGLPLVRRLSAAGLPRWLALATYLSVGWSLVSWWPHDNLHQHNGMDLQGLLYIEYAFHVTLMIAGGIVAYSFLSLVREKNEQPAPSSTPMTDAAQPGTAQG
jgi:hypothetical protein